MKKFMALSMAAVMVLSMTGCGSKPAETTTADTTAATEAAADTTAAESAAGTAASGKKYVINTDTTFAPFEFENEKGEMVGIDLDILKAIAQDQGFEYEVIPVGFSAACIALESGECDGVIAGMSITDERIQKYDFSEPYYDSGVGMAVLSGSDITTYDQLKGQNVAAKIGTEGCTFAESIADQYGFEVTQYESSSDMYQAVLSGEAAACFEDYPVIGYEISRGLELTLPTDMEKGSSYGFATLKGANPELVDMFNKGLENIKANGKYEEILNTYIAK
ncbi:MAG: transporter substrate-binding domain-containing protein [Clostridium sp.]|nr:transporter substrate-binding domain-containing protein [Clostridium sp.]